MLLICFHEYIYICIFVWFIFYIFSSLYYLIICYLILRLLFDVTLILQLVSITLARGYGGHVSLIRFKSSLWLRIYGPVSVDEPTLSRMMVFVGMSDRQFLTLLVTFINLG